MNPAVAFTLVLATFVLMRLAATASARWRAVERLPIPAGPGGPVVREPPDWFSHRLDETALPLRADDAWRAWLLGAVALPGAALPTGGVGLAVVVLTAAVGAPVAVWHALRHRRDARIVAALPDAVEAMARALRSGASLHQAVAEAAGEAPAAVRTDLQAVSDASRRGAPLVSAVDDWAIRRTLPEVRLVAAALALGAETGACDPTALDGVARTLRDRLAVAAEGRALATQARASAAVIASAPVAFCVLSAGADARTAHLLLATPLGWALLATGLLLDGAGGLWMAALARRIG